MANTNYFTKEQLIKAQELYNKDYIDNPSGYCEIDSSNIEEQAVKTIEHLLTFVEPNLIDEILHFLHKRFTPFQLYHSTIDEPEININEYRVCVVDFKLSSADNIDLMKIAPFEILGTINKSTLLIFSLK